MAKVPSPESAAAADLKTLATRLGTVYMGSVRIEELRYPGFARSAQLLFKKDSEKYAAIVCGLMDGVSPAQLGRRFRVDSNLVRFIRQMHPEAVAAARTQIVLNLEEVSLAMSRRLLEDEEGIRIDKVPQALSTVLDKLQLLTGGVTSRTEHVSAPRPEDLQAMFEALPAAKRIEEEENPGSNGLTPQKENSLWEKTRPNNIPG